VKIMAKATTNGIQIEYDTFGNRSGRPLLLIIGLALQMIHWSDEVCNQLADAGHYVIRFDNRDTGLSTKFDQLGCPDLMDVIKTLMSGQKYVPPYTLFDMGDDAVALLDYLGIEKAHICGMSMGANIAQTIAIKHPLKTLSLISIYGTTGNPKLPMPKPEISSLFMTSVPEEREACIDALININRKFGGSAFPFDEVWCRMIMGQAYDRSFYPEGYIRNVAAILARDDRREALNSVTAPTLVIHGDEDPVVPVEAAVDTARVIPGAELMIIKGLGHELPYRGAWPQIVEAITDHTKKEERQ
jgi:pimeloyl-ACP methyl ester carboxylesterase